MPARQGTKMERFDPLLQRTGQGENAMRLLSGVLAAGLIAGLAGAAPAAETPKRGGILT